MMKIISAARFEYTKQAAKLLEEESSRGKDKAQRRAIADKKAADELRTKIIEMREALGEEP